MLHSFVVDHQISHVLDLLVLVFEFILEEVDNFFLSAHPYLQLSDFFLVLNHLYVGHRGVF